MTRRRPFVTDDGAVPIEFALATGLLLIPVAALILVFPNWAERQSMARVAAQEAARAVALDGDWERGTASGTALARQTATNHGLDPGEVTVSFAGSLERGADVTATVTVSIPAVVIPGIGDAGSFDWTVSHSELVDPYRSFP